MRKVLEELSKAAKDDGAGVALLVDELQSLSKNNLGALVHLVQDIRDRFPFAFIGAGLPHLPSYIARATTYAERFRYEKTDNLQEAEAKAAVVEPAAAEGVEWDQQALAQLVRGADGYPFFLQLSAFEAWEAMIRRGGEARVTLKDIEVATPVVERLKETGIYAARFLQATEGERRYLFAMSDLLARSDGETVRSGDVARALGRDQSATSPARDSLIRKGMIHAPDHGLLAFSIPGFRGYLGRRTLDE
jgi:hypothetical protein